MSGLVLRDQAERDRFILDLDRHVSVIAPAGVGKTHALIDRIGKMAARADAVERLPRLVVVTYSVRAAQELKLRARARLKLSPEISAAARRALEQTFFGTIHSYCVRLLERFGPHLGLPTPLRLVEDEDELWLRFLRRGGVPLTDPALAILFRYFRPAALYALGKKLAPGPITEIPAVPEIDLGAVLTYRTTMTKATQNSINLRQAQTEQWRQLVLQNRNWHPLPQLKKTSDPNFELLVREGFAPLRDWVQKATLIFGRQLANAYEKFRRTEGVMTYDDQVRLALQLLQQPRVEREVRREGLSVLLDEAQDTDPLQFEVLRRVAGWIENHPAPGQTFCLVGDFQQSIYDRAEARTYRKTHDAVCALPMGQASTFQVTFRCDVAIIAWVNQIFPQVFDEATGQCGFVPLQPRPNAGTGQVVRWICPPPDSLGLKMESRMQHEAEALAQLFLKKGPGGFGVESWRDVAIICPRVGWLEILGGVFRRAGVPVQIHSSHEKRAQRPAAAWFTALLWIFAHPEDSFEIGGVLREIFGLSDEALARYTGGDGELLRLDHSELTAAGEVADVLRFLMTLQKKIRAMPLHLAVAEAVNVIHLRARLEAIEPGAGVELDELISPVQQRAAEGATWAEVAQEARRRGAQKQEQDEEIRDAVQLVTSFKAKGLEWKAVVLPYLFRQIGFVSESFPRVKKGGQGEDILELDKQESAGDEAELDLRQQQSLERLMYVAQTRAKQTLLVIDDELLFAGVRKKQNWRSSADLLKIVPQGVNRKIWEGLPDVETLVKFQPAHLAKKNDPGDQLELFLPAASVRMMPEILRERDVSDAVEQSRKIPERTTPHALANFTPSSSMEISMEPFARWEQEEELSLVGENTAAMRYGIWWHELMQEISWSAPREEWEAQFRRDWLHCPQPERGQIEWARLLKSDLAQWLSDPRRRRQSEMPFLWTTQLEGNVKIIEGIIDLVVADEETGEWQIIDWKTNRVSEGESGTAALVETYRGQIQAYREALLALLREQTGVTAQVRGSLYLTATGEWLRY